jgi:predicted nucleic acid-binding protein
VPPEFAHCPVLPDSDDETFLEAAINGQADALVTHNVPDFQDTDPHALPHGVPIVRPGDFLRRLPWRPSATQHSVFQIH